MYKHVELWEDGQSSKKRFRQVLMEIKRRAREEEAEAVPVKQSSSSGRGGRQTMPNLPDHSF